jgi:hypothetical protein
MSSLFCIHLYSALAVCRMRVGQTWDTCMPFVLERNVHFVHALLTKPVTLQQNWVDPHTSCSYIESYALTWWLKAKTRPWIAARMLTPSYKHKTQLSQRNYYRSRKIIPLQHLHSSLQRPKEAIKQNLETVTTDCRNECIIWCLWRHWYAGCTLIRIQPNKAGSVNIRTDLTWVFRTYNICNKRLDLH